MAHEPNAADARVDSVIRVLITDDHPRVRMGLALLLGTAADIKVVGLARSGEEGVCLAARLEPDVVVMDLSMPGMNGHQATQEILATHPGTRVLILTAFPDRPLLDRALACGAVGSLLKDAEPSELLAAVRAAARQAGRARD
jgi:DNA-binding NarL/FixJ family response regulator